MSETTSDLRRAAPVPAASEATAAVAAIRVDPPHRVGDPPTADEPIEFVEVSGSASGDSPATPEMVAVIQRLRLQAEQLSMHLRLQEKDLSQRESQLHAQLAEAENQTRAARLWSRERSRELDERERELEQLATELTALRQSASERIKPSPKLTARIALALGQAAHTDDVANANDDDLLLRCVAQVQKVAQVLSGVANCDGPAEATLASLTTMLDDVQHLAQTWAGRATFLDQSEQALEQAQTQLAQERDALAKHRQQHELQLRVESRKASEQHRAAEAKLEQRRQLVEARAAQLQSRRDALDELRADVMRVHRESLELRLATEEAWAQLSGAVPPAALTQSLAVIRAQIAEHYRLAAVDVQQGRDELLAAGVKLHEQQERLALKRSELDTWRESVEADLRQQSERLVGREQQLDTLDRQRQQELDTLRQQNNAYQAEIRRLLSALRRDAMMSAA